MINQSLLAEIKHEGAQTRKVLERVPLDNASWQPHQKSMPIARLATHIAEIPGWTSRILSADEFDIATVLSMKPTTAASQDELLQIHDQRISRAIEDLQKANDEMLMKTWTFKRAEQIIVAMPRVAMIRTLAMNHLIHHRGQLTVYLRLLNVPVPGIYGPSADENF